MKDWQLKHEFKHKLITDREIPHVWHLVQPIDDKIKPIPTPNNKPDTKDFDLNSMFDVALPIEIEIGSGKGGFLVEYSQARPEINVLGAEIDTKVGKYGGGRIGRLQIKNAAMMRGDLLIFLRDYVKENSIEAFHMYFPDPWPKKKQRKKRLLKAELLFEMSRCAKQGAKFYWGTDFGEYNQEALELLNTHPNYHCLDSSASPTHGIQTNFEKKFIEEGRPIYRSVWEFSH